MLSRPRGRLVTLSALSVALFSVQLASAKRTAEKPVVAKRATAESAPAVSAPASVLPFVENDFALARAQALKSGKLLFVDAWALWCHTCLSMRNFVFTDVQLHPLANRLVYAAIDTEQPSSAAFLARFPISTWPTMLVIAPSEQGDQIVARFTGALSAKELSSRLGAVLNQQAQQQPKLAKADALAAAGQHQQAAAEYEEALEEPGSRPRALLGLIQSLRSLGQHARCADLYDRSFLQVGKSALATDFAAYAASCMDKLDDVDRRQKLRRQLRTDLGNLLDDPSADLAIDDRSDAYGTMVELSDALGESSEGDRLTTKRLALLEKAAATAASPVLAATFDAHRFDSYRRLKRWAIAEEMLLASAKALPSDYNPPARLARLYYETGRIEKAEAQIGTALSHCLGPRRASMFELRAAIQNSQNRSREAMASLMEAISVLTANQPAGAPESARVLSLRQQLAGLDAKRKEQPDDSDGAPQPVSPAQQNAKPGRKNSGQKTGDRKNADKKNDGASERKSPPPRYEPGTPVAQRKRDRRLATRDANLK